MSKCLKFCTGLETENRFSLKNERELGGGGEPPAITGYRAIGISSKLTVLILIGLQ